jgi:hypothetical protein
VNGGMRRRAIGARLTARFGAIMNRVLLLCACVLVAASLEASAMLTTITINSVEPFAAHTAFGSTGAYERVKGVFRGELDPQDARNRVIVNIDKAPRNAAGKVEYEADFFILRPVEAALCRY